MAHYKNIVGQKFGQYTVISFAESRKQKPQGSRAYWNVLCSCGTKNVVSGSSLKSGQSTMCSNCRLNKIILSNTNHNFVKDSRSNKHLSKLDGIKRAFYRCWGSMKSRCLDKNNAGYKNYGGRGITVCERWLKFENFKEDMWIEFYIRKSKGEKISLDRIKVNRGYKPSNCRWTTDKKQNRNRRNSSRTENLTLHRLWIKRLGSSITHVIAGHTKNSLLFNQWIGTTPVEFKKYLESLFLSGMSWNNYGSYDVNRKTWQVGHIIPCFNFDLTKVAQRKKCYNYKNLHPQWALENISQKGIKI